VTRAGGILLVVVFFAHASAGGLEFPDIGSEALGRGAAFTAKADDGTAIVYNTAGFARQRGTRLLFNGNLIFHSFEFQRTGVYPDNPANPQTPWGGQPFPRMSDQGPPMFAPTIVLSTDFGRLDRFTLFVGLFAPSSVGNRTYPLGVAGGLPSPSRYDNVQAIPLVVFPTIGFGARLTRWLDLGMALHIVAGKFDLTSVSFTDISRAICPNPEYQPCDSLTNLQTSGVTATASLGLMIRPARFVSFGINVRGPVYMNTDGMAYPTPPAALNTKIDPAPASFSTNLPWVLRFGVRLIYMKGTHEAGDFEVDGTYESWAQAQGDGPKVRIPELSIFRDVNPTIVHKYVDTGSVRAGGAINIRLPAGVLSLRAGVFYDSSATPSSVTRTDFDTLAKVGATGGISYRIRGFTLSLAYAYLHSFSREVTDGEIRPINPVQGGTSDSSVPGMPLPVVNNGTYTSNHQILSMGFSIAWDELVHGRPRLPRYAADYEESTAPPPPPPAPEAEPESEPESEVEADPEPEPDPVPQRVRKAKPKPAKKAKKRRRL
jgi:long-subunit fatty acid transport protein